MDILKCHYVKPDCDEEVRLKQETPYKDPSWEYHAFYDREDIEKKPQIPQSYWQEHLIEGSSDERESRKIARRHKLLSHELFPNAEYSIWLDGTMKLITSPEDLLKSLGDNDIALFKHKERSCIFEEAEAVINSKKDNPEIVKAQMEFYREQGFPERQGLAATGVLIRRHTPKVKEFNELWWSLVDKFSVRDQLSFQYCLWKLKMDCSYIQGDCARRAHATKIVIHNVHTYQKDR